MTRALLVALTVLSGCAAAGPSVIHLAPEGKSAGGANHAEFGVEGVGGLPLFAQSWRPDGAPKAALVIVHGLKDYSTRYSAFADQAVQHGYAVYAFDLRGHGKSAGDRVTIDSFDDYLGDLDKVMAMVRTREPGKPVFLFGHSMGGCIVTLYTLRQKPDLKGLILSGPALKPGDDVSKFLIASTHIVSAVAPGLPVLDLPNANFSRDPQVVADMDKDPLVSQGKGPAHTAAQLLDAMEEIDSKMEQLQAPLFDLHGTADKLTNPEGSKELVKRAASTDKTLKLYEGLYHDLLHEPERAQVMSDILAWMDAR
ncbi:MAG: lysophospholipase [Deltaproteobacteria bacterium]|nr:lysophospholipase [Deltaproteobacteria bacterium]